MKKTVCFGLLAMVLAFGFIGCGGDDGDNPIIKTYQGTANGETYVLKINETDGTYVLTVGGKTSAGTVSGSGNNLILTPTGKEPFNVTVSSSGITAITGAITFDNGDTAEGPGTVTPGVSNNGNNGGDPFSGTWTGTINDADIRIVAADGSYQQYQDNVELIRGTYTFSGNTVTSTVTVFNMAFIEGTGSPENWVAWANLPDEIKQYYVPETSTGTISGNTLTLGEGENRGSLMKQQ